MSIRRSLVLAALAVGLAAGCVPPAEDAASTGDGAGNGEQLSLGGSGRGAAGAPDEASDLTPDQEAALTELVEDAAGAVEMADGYWRTHWSEFFAGEYVSPEVRGGYFADENPPCGGRQENMAGNAYYCPADDYIAWDWNLLAENFADEAIGDSFVYYVIAHEWAHAIQARLDQSVLNLAAELEADCLAAATMYGSEADGVLIIEAGDRGEIFQSLASVADEYEWGDPRAHGSADERIEAFQRGQSGGVMACLRGGTS